MHVADMPKDPLGRLLSWSKKVLDVEKNIIKENTIVSLKEDKEVVLSTLCANVWNMFSFEHSVLVDIFLSKSR